MDFNTIHFLSAVPSLSYGIFTYWALLCNFNLKVFFFFFEKSRELVTNSLSETFVLLSDDKVTFP